MKVTLTVQGLKSPRGAYSLFNSAKLQPRTADGFSMWKVVATNRFQHELVHLLVTIIPDKTGMPLVVGEVQDLGEFKPTFDNLSFPPFSPPIPKLPQLSPRDWMRIIAPLDD